VQSYIDGLFFTDPAKIVVRAAKVLTGSVTLASAFVLLL
jgi:hypothetical protein